MDADFEREIEAFGVSGADRERLLGPQKSREFEVWEENRLALEVFLRMSTQWRVSEGVVRGLDYQSLRWIIGIYAASDERDIFEAVQAMEGAAMDVLNNRGD